MTVDSKKYIITGVVMGFVISAIGIFLHFLVNAGVENSAIRWCGLFLLVAPYILLNNILFLISISIPTQSELLNVAFCLVYYAMIGWTIGVLVSGASLFRRAIAILAVGAIIAVHLWTAVDFERGIKTIGSAMIERLGRWIPVIESAVKEEGNRSIPTK
jgi:hypothetical protein